MPQDRGPERRGAGGHPRGICPASADERQEAGVDSTGRGGGQNVWQVAGAGQCRVVAAGRHGLNGRTSGPPKRRGSTDRVGIGPVVGRQDHLTVVKEIRDGVLAPGFFATGDRVGGHESARRMVIDRRDDGRFGRADVGDQLAGERGTNLIDVVGDLVDRRGNDDDGGVTATFDDVVSHHVGAVGPGQIAGGPAGDGGDVIASLATVDRGSDRRAEQPPTDDRQALRRVGGVHARQDSGIHKSPNPPWIRSVWNGGPAEPRHGNAFGTKPPGVASQSDGNLCRLRPLLPVVTKTIVAPNDRGRRYIVTASFSPVPAARPDITMSLARTLRQQLAGWIASDRTPTRTGLRLEPLEQRQMMAGDVELFATDPGLPTNLDTDVSAQSGVVDSGFNRDAQGEPGRDLVQFAQDLDTAGATFYGADWCPACTEQKQLFEDGGQFLPYIDVTAGGGDRVIDSQFSNLNITTYPTWVFPRRNTGRRRPVAGGRFRPAV